MTREDEELLIALSRISKDSGAFALGVLENNISRDDQIDFWLPARRLGAGYPGASASDRWTRHRRQCQR